MNELVRFLFLFFIASGLVQAEPTSLKLNDGSVIKGEAAPRPPLPPTW